MPRNVLKRTLSATFVDACKPAAPGQRDDYWDDKVPGFGLRVTERGADFAVHGSRSNSSHGDSSAPIKTGEESV
jgi:hypothetical protein